MDFDSENLPDLPHQPSGKEPKVGASKLLVTCVVVAIVGAVMLPLLFWAFEAGWLEQLGIALLVISGVAFFCVQYAKSKWGSGR